MVSCIKIMWEVDLSKKASLFYTNFLQNIIKENYFFEEPQTKESKKKLKSYAETFLQVARCTKVKNEITQASYFENTEFIAGLDSF